MLKEDLIVWTQYSYTGKVGKASKTTFGLLKNDCVYESEQSLNAGQEKLHVLVLHINTVDK